MSENISQTKANSVTEPNTHPEGNGAPAASEKLFTQEEVNKIVSERLNRERAKAEPTEQDAREMELSKREHRLDCRDFLTENKYSEKLLDILDTSDVEKFKQTVGKLSDIFPIRTDLPRIVGASPMSSNVRDSIANAFKPKI